MAGSRSIKSLLNAFWSRFLKFSSAFQKEMEIKGKSSLGKIERWKIVEKGGNDFQTLLKIASKRFYNTENCIKDFSAKEYQEKLLFSTEISSRLNEKSFQLHFMTTTIWKQFVDILCALKLFIDFN